ncbi:MAG: aspartate-semialdehyde dehydrogenase [bacterium]
MKIAVVGATGLVGREILKVLREHNLIPDQIIPVASPKSVGKTVEFNGNQYPVVSNEQAVKLKPELAIFSAGAAVSGEWAPRYASVGSTVIDNSSAWRTDPEIPLVVPEINAGILTRNHKIIANPNCSTIQLVMVIAPLHRTFGIRRLVISTYQSVSGTGEKAVRQMENERRGAAAEMAYPYPIDLNLFPHGGSFLPNGYTTEEMKLVFETRKIVGDPSINITATIVRVPVLIGHSEAVNIEFKDKVNLQAIRSVLSAFPGVTIRDDVENNIYPMPMEAEGKDDVFVGRIRLDESIPNAVNLFIVADNLRKGAATNAVQIASYLISRELV